MRPSPAGTSITLPPDTGSRKEIEMKTRNRILHAALACALLSFAAAAAAQEAPARQPAPQASATPDAEPTPLLARSAERRVGKEGGSTCRPGGSQVTKKKN